MARGKKYPDDIKEKAYLMYATCGNINEVSRLLNVPYATVTGWIKAKEKRSPDEFDKLRNEKKKDFIDKSSEIIDKAINRLEKELGSKGKIPVNHLTTVIGTLYDKRALAKGESTQNTKIEFKMPKDVEKYAE